MMALDKIRVQIFNPSASLRCGHGFYQVEEDSLFVQLGQFSQSNRFFSYLESKDILLHINKYGQLIFVELNMPKRQWKTDPGFSLPITFTETDLLFVDFRKKIKAPSITSNKNKTLIKLHFETDNKIDNSSDSSYLLSENVIAQVSKEQTLSSIFITGITDDFAGRELKKFRKRITGSAQNIILPELISRNISYRPD